ncbi:MAG: hypothetical protein ABI988_05120, partial [Nitrospirota bacterium]
VAGVRLSFMASTIDTRGHFTMVYQGGRYQMHETIRAPTCEWEPVDGRRRITHQGRPLGVHAITSRPVKIAAGAPSHPLRRPVTPRPDHPWRRRLRPERRTQATGAGTSPGHCYWGLTPPHLGLDF